ncbi:MAG: hypothetical protein CBC09_04650 [Cellvibrionales bacterium TMED49]|nr:hypothetical protein [Porticoccaceae bacterium]OUU38729.1 MAG: hypothetical protein CBC09_04650 [Cellvibrionales bacterium TMED49]|tara:strand:+ start:580 stop:873 length:294 start_codon:yes stop_codon:yes gene_type:complete
MLCKLKIRSVAVISVSLNIFLPAIALNNLEARVVLERPNSILVITDDQGYGDIGLNNPILKTRTIDNPAQNNILFTNFHVNPVCSPTRAALLSGNAH